MNRFEENKFQPISMWKEDERPREKLMQKGKNNLSEAELIAILIRTGSRNESAVELARKLLDSAGNNLIELGKRNISDLIRLRGMGATKAATLVAAMELGRRRQSSDAIQRKQIRKSQDIYNYLGPQIADLPHEEFWIIALNRNNRVIGARKIGSGGIDSTIADVRIILRYCLENGASALILCHNHPSGNLKPSESDIRLTGKVKKSAELMDINLLDHLIISDSGYFSFADENIL